MIKEKYKIYSTLPHPVNQKQGMAEIETIILNGLYKFSILGISQKNSSDIKDRVYSALRAQKLINLKSDNKKITVNVLPGNIDKKTNIYDLGIALGCLYCMGQFELQDDVAVIGELSISGNILPTKMLLKTLHQALQKGVSVIICPEADLINIDNYANSLLDILEKHTVKFIASNNLGDLVAKIKAREFYQFKNSDIRKLNRNVYEYTDLIHDSIYKIFLGICTGRNIFIENKKDSYIRKFIKNLGYYGEKLNSHEILSTANLLDANDDIFFESYTNAKISHIENLMQKEDLVNALNESVYGFNVIDNFNDLDEDLLYLTKKHSVSSILAFYNSCPCGNSNTFFSSIGDDKCLCLQRNILRYRQKIKRKENCFFDFYIHDIKDEALEYSPADYINLNRIWSMYRNSDIAISVTDTCAEFIKNRTDYEKEDLDKIVLLAKDIRKLDYVMKGKTKMHKTELCINDIRKAMLLIKKDL